MEGDPHSPWRFGETFWGLTKGLCYAHMGWLFHRELSNRERFAPDLVADKDIQRVDKLLPRVIVSARPLPAVVGGLVTWSWQGALSRSSGPAWSGSRCCTTSPGRSTRSATCTASARSTAGDKATNFWPLAILSFGESWHNLHHADPTCARHGVLRGQIDINARVIWIFEKFGWVSNVRWPKPDRLDAKLLAEPGHRRTASDTLTLRPRIAGTPVRERRGLARMTA